MGNKCLLICHERAFERRSSASDQTVLSDVGCNRDMTAATRIYKHSSVGTDWAALVLGAGSGLTLALQMTTVRASDFNSFYAVVVSVSQSATVVGPLGWLCDAMATAVMVGGQDSVAWFGQDELLEYQVFGVNRHEDTAWEI